MCDLDPKVKVIDKKAGICDGVPSTAALVTYYSHMLFIAYTFKGQVHDIVFAGGLKIVSHSSCRTSTLLKYFCTLPDLGEYFQHFESDFLKILN